MVEKRDWSKGMTTEEKRQAEKKRLKAEKKLKKKKLTKKEQKQKDEADEKARLEKEKAEQEIKDATAKRRADRAGARFLKQDAHDKKMALLKRTIVEGDVAMEAFAAAAAKPKAGEEDTRPLTWKEQRKLLHEIFCKRAHKRGKLPCIRAGLVIQKLIVTADEADRKKAEEHMVDMARVAWNTKLDFWFTGDSARNKIRAELRKRKGKQRGLVKRARASYKNSVLEKDKAIKAGKAIAKRKANLEAGGNYQSHRYDSGEQANGEMKEAQNSVNTADGECKKMEKLQVMATKGAGGSGATKMAQDAILKSELLNKYVALEAKKVTKQKRFEALEKGQRRPWDGANGRDFLEWRQKLDQQWSDSESEEGTSEEVDINDDEMDYAWDSADEEEMWDTLVKQWEEVAAKEAAEAQAKKEASGIGAKFKKVKTVEGGATTAVPS